MRPEDLQTQKIASNPKGTDTRGKSGPPAVSRGHLCFRAILVAPDAVGGKSGPRRGHLTMIVKYRVARFLEPRHEGPSCVKPMFYGVKLKVLLCWQYEKVYNHDGYLDLKGNLGGYYLHCAQRQAPLRKAKDPIQVSEDLRKTSGRPPEDPEPTQGRPPHSGRPPKNYKYACLHRCTFGKSKH